jgi:hypothetical protein
MTAARQDYGCGRRRAHQAGEEGQRRGPHKGAPSLHGQKPRRRRRRQSGQALAVNADVAVTMKRLFVSRSVTPRRQTASSCFNRRRPSELWRNAAVMSRFAPPGH